MIKLLYCDLHVISSILELRFTVLGPLLTKDFVLQLPSSAFYLPVSHCTAFGKALSTQCGQYVVVMWNLKIPSVFSY